MTTTNATAATNNAITNPTPGSVQTPTNSPVVQSEPGASVSVNNTPEPTHSGSSAGTDPNVSPVVTTADPAPAPAADPAAANADPNKPAGAPTYNMPQWAQDRINTLTYHRREAERKAETEAARVRAAEEAKAQAEQRVAELLKQLGGKDGTPPANAAGTPPAAAPKQLTEDEINRIAEEKAAQIAAARVFNEKCDSVADSGKKEFGADWDAALRNLGLVGAVGKEAPIGFLQTAIELQNPHKVLNYLGKQENLDTAERLLKMPPTKMALELARIEAKVNAPVVAPPAPVSGAPAPVIPVVGKGTPSGPVELNDASTSMDAWMQERMKQLDAKRERYRR